MRFCHGAWGLGGGMVNGGRGMVEGTGNLLVMGDDGGGDDVL